ncbi:MAG TPA: sugar ABC transporter permease [Microbacteriaceae bacterium]
MTTLDQSDSLAAAPERDLRARSSRRGRKRSRGADRGAVGWLFIAPFGVVFAVFLLVPLGYAFYLSLYTKGLATGTVFTGLDNYVKAFTDPSFLSGVWFVVRFSVVMIPVQMGISLIAALLLDAMTTRLARFSRLAIFLPYAVPAVIGALMWGFLYSRNFGPLQDLFTLFNAQAPNLIGGSNVFGGLMNVVTWQWAGYYMIILYAALQGIDPSLYEAARIDGAKSWQIAVRIKIPMIAGAINLVLIFALIGTLQFFTEPQILQPISDGAITSTFTPNIYAFNLAFSYSQFNYASAISFALGIVVFIGAYIFLFVTRQREARQS